MNTLVLRTAVETWGKDLTTVADFTVAAGERVPFVLAEAEKILGELVAAG